MRGTQLTQVPEGTAHHTASRRAVLSGASLLAGGILVGGIGAPALGSGSRLGDAEILNFALEMEELQGALYAQALQHTFAATARALEDLGVAALDGQAASLTKLSLASVATIVSVEARHAAWIRDLLGELPAPSASNPAQTAAQVRAAIRRTGFVKGTT